FTKPRKMPTAIEIVMATAMRMSAIGIGQGSELAPTSRFRGRGECIDFTKLPRAPSRMRHDLAFQPLGAQFPGDGLGAGAVLLRPDAHAVQLARGGIELAQEGRVAFRTQLRREPVG